jgi:hypothetical protein
LIEEDPTSEHISTQLRSLVRGFGKRVAHDPLSSPWPAIGKRFGALRPLTKIYVCTFGFVIWLVIELWLSGLGFRGSAAVPVATLVAFGLVAIAAALERLVLNFVAWRKSRR